MKMSKVVTWSVCLGVAALLSASPAQAQQQRPQVGEVWQELSGDIDSDGQSERVCLVPFEIDESGQAFMQLKVYDHTGEMIWETPKIKDYANKRAFGNYNFGDTDIQLLCDLDKDGRMDLIGAMPRSDMRPILYRVWTWTGGCFEPKFTGYLYEVASDNGEHSNVYKWSHKLWNGSSSLRWIDHLSQNGSEIVADIIDVESGKLEPLTGKAQVQIYHSGFLVSDWLKHIVRVKY